MSGVCMCVTSLHILVGTNNNARPHEFEGIFKTLNVVLVSGLLLGIQF